MKTKTNHSTVIAAIEDFGSHMNDWRKALDIAKQAAIDNDDPEDDGSYWDHQIKVFNRVSDGLGFK